MGIRRERRDAAKAVAGAKLGAMSWRREVVYLPQSVPALQGSPSDFLEEVCSFRTRSSCTSKEVSERCAGLAKEFGLSAGVSQKPWSELSGGERHRSMLALVVALEPQVLIVDEPTSACDAETTKMIEACLIREAEKGLCVIWVTHAADQAARVASRRLDLVVPERSSA